MTIALLLAAGSASRMGKPKMLLHYHNQTFLQHIIEEVKKCPDMEMIVVTGCYHSLIKSLLMAQQIPFVENTDWENGMGTSIKTGINYITVHHPDADNVLILVCDQPFVSSGVLAEILAKQTATGKGIIASAYSNTMGTPVLFDKKYFSHLLALNGQNGAKKIVQQFVHDVATVEFAEGRFDIDTPGDYDALQ